MLLGTTTTPAPPSANTSLVPKPFVPAVPALHKGGHDETVFAALRPSPTRLFHRIIELLQLGLEGTFRGHPVQPPCNVQGHLQLDQIAQSPIQPGLECFQGWGICHVSGQPVPVSHHLHCKKNFFLISNVNLPSFLFKIINPCPVATAPAKKSVSSFLISLL